MPASAFAVEITENSFLDWMKIIMGNKEKSIIGVYLRLMIWDGMLARTFHFPIDMIKSRSIVHSKLRQILQAIIVNLTKPVRLSWT